MRRAASLSFMAGLACAACSRQSPAPMSEASTSTTTEDARAASSPTASASSSTTETVDASLDAARASLDASLDAARAFRDGGKCDVRVGALLKAEVGAGPGPISRSHDDAIRALDPDTAARWRSRDHGMTHLTCTYRMTMNGSLYTYAHIAKQALTNGEPLDPATCRTQATRQEAVRRMREFTEGCSDPHAGAYWGFDLTLDP